ncbi:MAG: choloylglycine hydrolase [Clostridia bacterium]|nr:choloylglycine hydrolase [Clostridia bacterium]
MCTAISYKDRYFGRTLDWEQNFGECVTVTGRDFDFKYRKADTPKHHSAIMGMAKVVDGYPLYFDAVNEYGLCMAGLNFTLSAEYGAGGGNLVLCPFEFIPYVLSSCRNMAEARELLEHVSLSDEDFSPQLKNARLHWMLSDGGDSLVIEPRAGGLEIHENNVGVLANEPPFDYHLYNLANYLNVTSAEPRSRFAEGLTIHPYSRGMGGVGLAGDNSSQSRFIRAAFARWNSHQSEEGDEADVTQFFHILGVVEQVEGCVRADGGYERTQYTSCIDTKRGIYYYKTYENSALTAVNMSLCQIDGAGVYTFPLRRRQVILNAAAPYSLSDS